MFKYGLGVESYVQIKSLQTSLLDDGNYTWSAFLRYSHAILCFNPLGRAIDGASLSKLFQTRLNVYDEYPIAIGSHVYI